MPLSWMRRNGGMSQALSPCTLCISAPWISGRLWICAVMPSRFMRSSCASRDLVEVRERPAQPLDRPLLVERLVDVEEGVDRRASSRRAS